MKFSFALFALFLAFGCSDPCADVAGTPTLTLAGSSDDGSAFELFDDGAERTLLQGPQIGMHIWLQLRLEGFCPSGIEVDRRVVDATDALVEIQRSPLRFTEGVTPGSFELDNPIAMQVCPAERPVVGETLRFSVRAEDTRGNVDIAEKAFVPVCPTATCEICGTP